MILFWKVSSWIFKCYFIISIIVEAAGLLNNGLGLSSTSPKSSASSSESKNIVGGNGRKSASPSSTSSSGENYGPGPGSPNNMHYCHGAHKDLECSKLGGDCLDCNFESVRHTCHYGSNITVQCNVTSETTQCKGPRQFFREMKCQYCYQSPIWQQICNGDSRCNSIAAPRQNMKVNCTVIPELLCFGLRRFYRMKPCNWKNGYRWSTTFILSVTLGGFGADRFYLGRWQEGIGKLFSFGGLGVWTIIDIILIGVRYLGPADGSLYVD